MKHLLPLLLLLATLTACEQRNIHQVMKEIAEAPVDTVGLQAQTIRTNLFSAVDVDCFADVTYHQVADRTPPYVRLRASAEILENLSVRVESNVLEISVNRRYRMPEKAVVVMDIYAPYVSRFSMNGVKCLRLGRIDVASPLSLEIFGVGAITAEGITAPELTAKMNGTASLDLRGIETGLLRTYLYGDSRAFLSGHSSNTELLVQGEGRIDASVLRSDTPAKVTTRGGTVKQK